MTILRNIGVGIALDKTVGLMQGASKKFTAAQGGRFANLSYKPKYEALSKEYLLRGTISDVANSAEGAVVSGMLSNSTSAPAKDDKMK